jgi:hypothetical protein
MKLVISGETPSQKNRKIISMNRATGRPFLRSAPAVKEWQESASQQLIEQYTEQQVREARIDEWKNIEFSQLEGRVQYWDEKQSIWLSKDERIEQLQSQQNTK